MIDGIDQIHVEHCRNMTKTVSESKLTEQQVQRYTIPSVSICMEVITTVQYNAQTIYVKFN